MTTYSAFASCAPGIEEMLLEEVSAILPESKPAVVAGGVEFLADKEGVYLANIHLGLAIRVLVRVGVFRVKRFDKLVKAVSALPFGPWLSAEAALDIRVKCTKSKLYHSAAVAQRVAEGMASQVSIREDSPLTSRIQVRIVNDECTVSVDTSGEALHRRGYRLASGKAPLREDLARALLLASNWKPGMALIDPMSGAGTLVIEAALMAAGVPAGAHREFAFQKAKDFDASLFKTLKSHSRAKIDTPILLGSDRDPQAPKFAISNAERAGITELVRFEHAELSRSPHFAAAHQEQGAIVTNPPYGKRTGRSATLRALYQSLGKSTAKVPETWGFGLVTANRKLAYATQVNLESSLRTRNGALSVGFYRKRQLSPEEAD